MVLALSDRDNDYRLSFVKDLLGKPIMIGGYSVYLFFTCYSAAGRTYCGMSRIPAYYIPRSHYRDLCRA